MKTEDRALDESFDSDTMSEAEDIFATPGLKYLSLKKSFLKKARNFLFWGSNGSRQRVIALDTMLRYFQESMMLLDRRWDNEAADDVILDIKNFVLKKQVFHVPKVICEKLSSALDEYPEHRPHDAVHDMMEELGKLRDVSMARYEQDEWSRMHQFDRDSFDLRKLRKRIYNEVNVGWDIQQYDFEVEQLLEKYSDILTSEEVKIWKQKRLDTIQFAEASIGVPIKEICWSDDLHAFGCSANAQDELSTAQEESVPVESVKKDSYAHEVQDLVKANGSQDSLIENLPSVPVDEFFDNQNKVDQEIEERLLKIKFFRQTWCSQPSCVTEPTKKIPIVVEKASKPKGKEVVMTGPTFCNRISQESRDFNEWYLDRCQFQT